MNCAWYEPGYWIGWPWFGQIFWLLLQVGLGYLVYKTVYNSRRIANQNHSDRFNDSPQGNCPNCNAPVENSFIRCPECHFKLKSNCPSCGRIVKTNWEICPYCEAKITITKEQEVTN
jgi:RNA polymerase subunit RPABC4/transcription elongation factor Spt4